MFGMYPIVEAEQFYSFPYQDYHTGKHTPFKKNTPLNDVLLEMFEDDIFNTVFEIEPRLKTPKNKKNQEIRGLYHNSESFSASQDSVNSFSSSCSSSEENLKQKRAKQIQKNEQNQGKVSQKEENLNKLRQEQNNRKSILKKQQQIIQKRQRENSLIDYCFPLIEVNEKLEETSEKDLRQEENQRRSRKNSRQMDEQYHSLSSIKDEDLYSVEEKEKQGEKEKEKEKEEEKINEQFYTQTQSIRSYYNSKGEKTVIQKIEQNKNGDLSVFVSKKIYDKDKKLLSHKKWREDANGNKINDIKNKGNQKANKEQQTEQQDYVNQGNKSKLSYDPRIVKENSQEKEYYGDNEVIIESLSNPKQEIQQQQNLLKDDKNKTNFINQNQITISYSGENQVQQEKVNLKEE